MDKDDGGTSYALGMWPTALDLPATLYPYGNYENKAFGGTTVLAITAYGRPTAPSYAAYRIDIASTYWKTYQQRYPVQLSLYGETASTPILNHS